MKAKKNHYRRIHWEGLTQRINEVFREKGLKQVELAKALDKTQPQIHYYLKGKSFPRLEVLQKISFILGVDYNWLRYEEGKLKFYNKENYPYELLWISFAERLKFLLWVYNKSPLSLSKELNISSTSLTYYIEGSRYPGKRIQEKLIKHFNVSEEWLFAEDHFDIDDYKLELLLQKYGEKYLLDHRYNPV